MEIEKAFTPATFDSLSDGELFMCALGQANHIAMKAFFHENGQSYSCALVLTDKSTGPRFISSQTAGQNGKVAQLHSCSIVLSSSPDDLIVASGFNVSNGMVGVGGDATVMFGLWHHGGSLPVNISTGEMLDNLGAIGNPAVYTTAWRLLRKRGDQEEVLVSFSAK